MPGPKNHTTINAYARSLLELANEQNQTDAVAGEISSLRDIVRANPSFGEFLSDPSIGAQERAAVIDRTFGGGKVSPLLFNFLRVLDHHRRAGLLAEIGDAFDELLADQRGIVEVDVTVAHRLDDAQLELVRSRVSQALGKHAVVHQYVDESIIGGIMLRVGDRLIDASARFQLQTLRQRMIAARRR